MGADPMEDLSALRWTCLMDPPLPGWRNMARDHGLALAAKGDGAVVRFYAWETPTVSLGRNEPALGRYDHLRTGGLDFVRRPTGGRAVLHDGELTYAVVVPRGAISRMRRVYAVIQAGLVDGLTMLGVGAGSAGAGPAQALDSGPCFAGASEGEVVVDGRKILGSAQARIEGAILQHGSLLLRNDQRLLGGVGTGDVEGRGALPLTLEDALGRLPPWKDVASALRAGLSGRLGVEIAPRLLTKTEISAEESLEARYRCDDWTWRA